MLMPPTLIQDTLMRHSMPPVADITGFAGFGSKALAELVMGTKNLHEVLAIQLTDRELAAAEKKLSGSPRYAKVMDYLRKHDLIAHVRHLGDTNGSWQDVSRRYVYDIWDM